jgi:hypothetical protein
MNPKPSDLKGGGNKKGHEKVIPQSSRRKEVMQ